MSFNDNEFSHNTVLDSHLEQAINDAGSYLSYIQRMTLISKLQSMRGFHVEDIDRVTQKEIRSDERMKIIERKLLTLQDELINKRHSTELDLRGLSSRKLRSVVLSHYGGGKIECVCCSEKQFDFLTLDHVNDDGYRDEVKKTYRGKKYYKYLIEHDFPSNLQTFCWNCNCGKARNGGVCPHSKQKILNSI